MMDLTDDNSCSNVTVSVVFKQYLNELALSEFPRGNGKWRNELKWDSDSLERKEDNGASSISVESLLELSYQKPFHKGIGWSSDAKWMLEQAIKFPDKIKPENIHKEFKSLRLVNKKITDIDEYICKFENLESLVVSANDIKTLTMKFFPRSLCSLELCGNKLGEYNIACLRKSPPPLQHLGLSYNCITTISDFIKPLPNCWKALLSLDLSFNKLMDLFQIVDILKRLEKLRNLHLIGNPLFLFPGYRGYVIDSLKTLAFLDEMNISAHERFLFKGMNKIKDSISSDYSIVLLTLDNFNGKIRNDDIEKGDEVIRTFIKYHVELTFLKDCIAVDVDEFSPDRIEDECPVFVIPENNDTLNSDSCKVVKSNEFNFLEENTKFMFNKYMICNNLMQLTQLLADKIELRFMKTHITMSKEPIETENIPVFKESEKNGKKDASKESNKRRSSLKSTSSEKSKPRANTTTEKPKKTKKPKDEEYYELKRSVEKYSAVDMSCQSLLDGSLSVESDCSFLPLHVPETDVDTENINSNADKPKKKTGKTSKQPHAKNTKVVEIVDEADSDMEEPPCEPPSLHYQMKMIHWKDAKEGFDWVQRFGKLE